MRQFTIAAVFAVIAAAPCNAVDFLGVELCTDQVSTGVILPAESPLSLESAELGRHGDLVLLLHSKKGTVLNLVDDLMEPFVGSRGTGDEKRLEWSGSEITAFAQVIQKGYVALAVSAAKDCTVEPEAAPAAVSVVAAPNPPVEPAPIEEAIPAVAATAVAADLGPEPKEPAAEVVDFQLEGKLKHAAAEDGWVDVMGVVTNNSGASYTVASFDLSLYDGADDLICVDTVSVNQLREGQERAFRGAIRCADYDSDEVASWKLQFAGGH